MENKSGYKFTNLMHNLLIISLITICRTDCGIFVIKFMQLWSNSGLSCAIANVLYCADKIFFIFDDREFSLIFYYVKPRFG